MAAWKKSVVHRENSFSLPAFHVLPCLYLSRDKVQKKSGSCFLSLMPVLQRSATGVMIVMNFRSRPKPSLSLAAVAWRLGLFSGLWFLLSGGDIKSWPFGLAASLLATWLLVRLPLEQPRRVRPLAIVWFIPYFVGRSLLSGVDVMKRVLHPALPIDPALVDYPLVIDHQGGRVLLANCVSLLPGTISARLGPDILLVHSLDKELPVVETIQDLERRIARLYHPAAKAKRPEGQP